MSQPRYDLEQRNFIFAQRIRQFLKQVPKCPANAVDGRQLVRSSGSVGANYLEANDALGKRDFAMRIRISRKEAKESCYWLGLLDLSPRVELEPMRKSLVDEGNQLVRIFSAILQKATSSPG